MLEVIQFGFYVFVFLSILLINYAVFFGGWNLLARLIQKIVPSLDLKVCQEWRQTVGSDGRRGSTPVHTPIQWLVFFLVGVPFAISCYWSIGSAFSWMFK